MTQGGRAEAGFDSKSRYSSFYCLQSTSESEEEEDGKQKDDDEVEQKDEDDGDKDDEDETDYETDDDGLDGLYEWTDVSITNLFLC